MGLLSTDEKQRIEQAVALAERRTAGELVVVVAERSSDYAAFRAGLGAALTVALAIEAVQLDIPTWLVLLLQLPAGAVWYAVLGHPAWVRWFVPKAVRQRAVAERALTVFLESGVSETRDRSGVLVFLSEAERRAVILADKGINARVAPEEWQSDIETLVRAIREGDAARGLAAVIERIGGILAETFPPGPDDRNELADAVREL
jgi:putative membrane protein